EIPTSGCNNHQIHYGELGRAQKNRETFAHANVFAAAQRVPEMIPSACQEHESHHDTQEEKRDISKTSQRRKVTRGQYSCHKPRYQRQKEPAQTGRRRSLSMASVTMGRVMLEIFGGPVQRHPGGSK